jgi:endo-chitodextinase
MKQQRATGLGRVAGLVAGALLAVAAAAGSTEAAAAGSVSLTAVGVTGPVLPGSRVLLHATVADLASLRSVRFYDGANQIGSDRSAPWEYTVRRISAGRHLYKAQAVLPDGTRIDSPAVEVVAVRAPPNQPPTVSILTPANNTSFAQGTAVDLTADARDPDGSVARVEYWRGTTQLGAATAAPFKLTLAAAAAGSYSVVAKAVDDRGATTSSTPVAFTVVAPPTATAPDDGARLLLQATFGPTAADVTRVRQLGVNGWLDEQFAMPLTYSHLKYMRDVQTITGMEAQEQHAYEAIWQNYLFGADQLRARVAFALSEIVVISNIAPDQNPWALASWMDMLYRNAFGNYRTLLGDATLHPAMGYFLNMLGNDREFPEEGNHPNENYAREVEQLFSIGLVKLNTDGTPVKDAQGKTTPTYDQSVVEGFARVFTGWNFAGNNTASDDDFYWPNEDWINPMVAWPAHHEAGTKQLLDGVVLPAGQTPQKDLKDALDLVFNHPNVGPFVSRRLIQFLVTSNPSPQYVGRVAAAFNNNGGGVRGDLKAVVRAVLTDTEARDLALAAQPTYGKLREPVIRFTHLMRATGARAANGRNSVWWLDSPEDGLGQSPLLAPSVFNFFSPFYTKSGAIAQAGLVAPEFQIHTETQVVGNANFHSSVLWNRGFGFADAGWLAMDLAPWTSIAGNAGTLVDQLNLVFTANSMTAATRATLAKAVNAIPSGDRAERVRAALTLLMVTPDFVVQH